MPLPGIDWCLSSCTVFILVPSRVPPSWSLLLPCSVILPGACEPHPISFSLETIELYTVRSRIKERRIAFHSLSQHRLPCPLLCPHPWRWKCSRNLVPGDYIWHNSSYKLVSSSVSQPEIKCLLGFSLAVSPEKAYMMVYSKLSPLRASKQ